MKRRNKSSVFAAIRMAARAHHVLTVGTLLCVASSVVASLLPPLLLARSIDGLTAGLPLTLWAVLAYFCSLAAQDWETAFRASHTLKGVAQNLGMEHLYQVSSALCEAVRGPCGFAHSG